MKKLIVILFIMGSFLIPTMAHEDEPIYTTNYVSIVTRNNTGESITNMIPVVTMTWPVVEVFNCWWEIGTYTSNIVAKFRAEDVKRYKHYHARYVNTPTNDVLSRKWLYERMQPKYTHITTNTVWWMKAHPATTNDPYIVVNAWHRWGWFSLYWRESLTEGKWMQVCNLSHQHSGGIRTYKIYMNPKSEVTKKMLASKTGFFCQSAGLGRFSYFGKNIMVEKLYTFDMSNFFPKPKPPTDTEKMLMLMEASVEKSSGPPPIPQ